MEECENAQWLAVDSGTAHSSFSGWLQAKLRHTLTRSSPVECTVASTTRVLTDTNP